VGHFVEAIIFNSRWLIAPFLLGLVVGLAALVLKFLIKLYEFVVQIPQAPPADVIVGILTLVDLTLVASLIVLVICSIYDNFISDIDPEKHPEWPEGLVKIGFSGLKQKLFGAIAVIRRGQRAGMVHGHRAPGRQHQAGLGRRHSAGFCSLHVDSCHCRPTERAEGKPAESQPPLVSCTACH